MEAFLAQKEGGDLGKSWIYFWGQSDLREGTLLGDVYQDLRLTNWRSLQRWKDTTVFSYWAEKQVLALLAKEEVMVEANTHREAEAWRWVGNCIHIAALCLV